MTPCTWTVAPFVRGAQGSVGVQDSALPGPASEGWTQECRQAFLRGYAGGELSSADAAAVRAYEADKAIYEVIYEVRNRPDWVSIPLAAVATLAQTEPELKKE